MATRKKVKTAQVNLLPREGLSASTSGRVLLWILSSFRFVLIITELIVIFAFLSRFWLDAKNTNITEDIDSARSQIVSLSDFEKDFKNTQEKLAIYEQYKQSKGKLLEGVEEVVAFKPEAVFFESVTSDSEKVVVKGSALTETEIHQFLANLNSSEKFNKVKLESVDVGNDQILFSFTIVSYYNKT